MNKKTTRFKSRAWLYNVLDRPSANGRTCSVPTDDHAWMALKFKTVTIQKGGFAQAEVRLD